MKGMNRKTEGSEDMQNLATERSQVDQRKTQSWTIQFFEPKKVHHSGNTAILQHCVMSCFCFYSHANRFQNCHPRCSEFLATNIRQACSLLAVVWNGQIDYSTVATLQEVDFCCTMFFGPCAISAMFFKGAGVEKKKKKKQRKSWCWEKQSV